METEEDQSVQDAQAITVGITGAQERAARAFHLLQQSPLTTAEVAHLLGMTYNGAKALLWKVSRAVPIYYCEDSGEWKTLDDT